MTSSRDSRIVARVGRYMGTLGLINLARCLSESACSVIIYLFTANVHRTYLRCDRWNAYLPLNPSTKETTAAAAAGPCRCHRIINRCASKSQLQSRVKILCLSTYRHASWLKSLKCFNCQRNATTTLLACGWVNRKQIPRRVDDVNRVVETTSLVHL